MDAYDIAAVHDSLSERFTYGHRIPDDNDDIVSHVVSGKISVGYRLENDRLRNADSSCRRSNRNRVGPLHLPLDNDVRTGRIHCT